MTVATITIRRARIEDAAAIANVHVESWRSTYAGMLPEDMLVKLSSAAHETRWWGRVLGRSRRRHYIYVAEHAEAGVVGFISGGPSRDRKLREDGEVYALYLLDEYHGQGMGRSLFVRLAARLRREFGPSLLVWVLSNNPSRFFYEAMGGRRVATRDERMGEVSVTETGYGWVDTGELVLPGQAPPS